MTFHSRHLLSGYTATSPPSENPLKNYKLPNNSNFTVILAVLLCGLICALGLVIFARCTYTRRLNLTSTSPPAANKGVKKKVLKSLPSIKYGEDEKQVEKLSEECAICLSEFEEGEEIRVLPQCGHGFHIQCIDTWLGNHASCPSCRQILVVSNSRCKKCGVSPAPEPRENYVASFLP